MSTNDSRLNKSNDPYFPSYELMKKLNNKVIKSIDEGKSIKPISNDHFKKFIWKNQIFNAAAALFFNLILTAGYLIIQPSNNNQDDIQTWVNAATDEEILLLQDMEVDNLELDNLIVSDNK